jgi:energy-coupling factor transporter ATP-binding protein EcfA2
MLLLDEPFGMLDSLTRMELQEVLLELLAREQKTTLMVTHDVDEALFMSDRVVMMTTGPGPASATSWKSPSPAPRADARSGASDYYNLRERLSWLPRRPGSRSSAPALLPATPPAMPPNPAPRLRPRRRKRDSVRQPMPVCLTSMGRRLADHAARVPASLFHPIA